MSTYLSLAGMPGNLHLLTAGWRFIHAIWRQPTAGDWLRGSRNLSNLTLRANTLADPFQAPLRDRRGLRSD
jgi:hypothetical protein